MNENNTPISERIRVSDSLMLTDRRRLSRDIHKYTVMEVTEKTVTLQDFWNKHTFIIEKDQLNVRYEVVEHIVKSEAFRFDNEVQNPEQ